MHSLKAVIEKQQNTMKPGERFQDLEFKLAHNVGPTYFELKGAWANAEVSLIVERFLR